MEPVGVRPDLVFLRRGGAGVYGGVGFRTDLLGLGRSPAGALPSTVRLEIDGALVFEVVLRVRAMIRLL